MNRCGVCNMNKIFESSILVISDDVVSCDLDGETAILNIESGIYYGLDPIGAKIWNSLQKPCSISYLVNLIINEYNVTEKRCKTDIFELLNDFINNGLVKVNASN
jgi:hypothetical protein